MSPSQRATLGAEPPRPPARPVDSSSRRCWCRRGRRARRPSPRPPRTPSPRCGCRRRSPPRMSRQRRSRSSSRAPVATAPPGCRRHGRGSRASPAPSASTLGAARPARGPAQPADLVADRPPLRRSANPPNVRRSSGSTSTNPARRSAGHPAVEQSRAAAGRGPAAARRRRGSPRPSAAFAAGRRRRTAPRDSRRPASVSLTVPASRSSRTMRPASSAVHVAAVGEPAQRAEPPRPTHVVVAAAPIAAWTPSTRAAQLAARRRRPGRYTAAGSPTQIADEQAVGDACAERRVSVPRTSP